MEHESGNAPPACRQVYDGRAKHNAVIYGIPNGIGSVAQNYTYPNGTERVVKLWYHQNSALRSHSYFLISLLKHTQSQFAMRLKNSYAHRH